VDSEGRELKKLHKCIQIQYLKIKITITNNFIGEHKEHGNVYLAVLSTAEFSDKLVVILISPLDNVRLVIPVLALPMRVHVRVDPGPTGQRHGCCL